MTNTEGTQSMDALGRQQPDTSSVTVIRFTANNESVEDCLKRCGHWPPNPSTEYTIIAVSFVEARGTATLH